MALGVLEDRKLENVPGRLVGASDTGVALADECSTGTSYVLDDNDSRAPRNAPTISSLKYDRSGPVPIILVPQPSDDPDDPLV